MITEVKKYLILGTLEDLRSFYERAQKGGFIEFISSSRKTKELPENIQVLFKALKIVKKIPKQKESEGEWTTEEIRGFAEDIIELKASIEKRREEERILDADIARISPLGNFSLEDIRYIEKEGHCKVQFFCIKSSKAESLRDRDGIFLVSSFFDLDYYMSVSLKPFTGEDLMEMRIDQSLEDLKEQRAAILESIHSMEVEIKRMAGYLHHFQELLVEELNRYHLESAEQEVSYPLQGASLFATEAWIPSSKISKMFSLLSGLSVHCEQIQIEATDFLPTVMENKGIPRLGEDLVRIYDVPASTDKDPSGWVFWFFVLFFAMIIADAGYGLLYLVTLLFLKWKLPSLKGAAKRLFQIAMALSIAIVLWGVLTCSYFGLEISPKSFLGKISPIQFLVAKKAEFHLEQNDEVYKEWISTLPQLAKAKTGKEFVSLGVKETNLGEKHVVYESFADSMLLEISLIFGILHITTSLMRYSLRNWANLGWIAFLFGGYLFFPSMLHVTSMANFMGWIYPPMAAALGKQLIYVGIGSAFALALVQRRWLGFKELTKVIELFGDVLSYLRLYALALAGTILAETFNGMGAAVGLVGGFFVIILGHGINISLGLMAGVIHGLRLNFIEWYHYSFEGGGRFFNPLKLLKLEDD